MAKRLDPAWVVLDSIENPQHDRCVDLFARPDGSFGFEAFRRDAEDAGAWTPVSYFCGLRFASRGEALAEAVRRVAWLAPDQSGWREGVTARTPESAPKTKTCSGAAFSFERKPP